MDRAQLVFEQDEAVRLYVLHSGETDLSERLARMCIRMERQRLHDVRGIRPTDAADAARMAAVRRFYELQASIDALDEEARREAERTREAERERERRAACQAHDARQAHAYATKELHRLAMTPPGAPFPGGGPAYQDAAARFEDLARTRRSPE